MLVTCQFEKVREYEGDIYRVVPTFPPGMDYPKIEAWPSANMWKKFKEGMISWDDFTKYYIKLCRKRRENFQVLAAAIVNRTIILCSWEAEHEPSYRSLIAKFLVEELGVAQELVQIH